MIFTLCEKNNIFFLDVKEKLFIKELIRFSLSLKKKKNLSLKNRHYCNGFVGFKPRFILHGERERLLKEHELIFAKNNLVDF